MIRHFSFAGMQRVGNHAIINWWLSHFDGYVCRNNILGLSCKDQSAQLSIKGKPATQIRLDSWENYDPELIQISPRSEPLIILVRDPYNWWASWFGYTIPNPVVHNMFRQDTIPMYLAYIKYIREHPNACIIFNHWFSSSEYRREIESHYELGPPVDTSLNCVTTVGASTFDAIYEYQGRAQDMAVLTRYEQVRHQPDYYEPLRQYPELADIAREVFDFEPPAGLH